MTVFVSDSFTNTDGTLLATHNADWSYHSSWAASANPRIGSNACVGGDVATSPAVVVRSAASTADYDVSATVTQLSTSAVGNAGVVARMRLDQPTGYMARYRYNTGVQLFVFNNSTTATQLGSTVSGNLSNGGTMRLLLRCSGNQISVYKDGSLIIGPITDNTVSAANRPGIWIYGTSTVGCSLDSWEADSLAAGSSIAAISNYYRMMRSA